MIKFFNNQIVMSSAVETSHDEISQSKLYFSFRNDKIIKS